MPCQQPIRIVLTRHELYFSLNYNLFSKRCEDGGREIMLESAHVPDPGLELTPEKAVARSGRVGL